MSNINFNLTTGGTITSAILTSDGTNGTNYGYQAVINGVQFGIHDISIVNSLKEYIPLLSCDYKDLEGVVKALKAPFPSEAQTSET